MKRTAFIAQLIGVWLALAHGANWGEFNAFAASRAPAQALLQAPVAFEQNQGQAPDSVQFITRIGPNSLLLSSQFTAFCAPIPGAPGHSVQIRLLGANPNSKLEGQVPLTTKVNYLQGSEQKSWHANIPTFAQIKAAQVYPGVDLVHYGQGNQLEYDFRLAPGSQPNDIRMEFSGIDALRVDAAGNLVAETAGTSFCQHAPVAWQMKGGQKIFVPARFLVFPKSNGKTWQVGFELAAYDASLPLVIDPVLAFATYWGGNGDDQAYSVAADSAGNVYVAGQTASPDFTGAKLPANHTNGLYDVFVSKFDANSGEMVYSTIVGGAGNDRGFSLAVDASNCVVVVGQTTSSNFPVKKAFHPFFIGGDRDAFVFKLNPKGSDFAFSTYVGGSSSDDLTCVTVDRAGNIFAGGGTSSTNFPSLKAFQTENRGGFDAIWLKFTPVGILSYSSYLGGTGPYDSAIGIAVDAENCVYLTGYTSSSDFPLVNPLQSKHFEGYDAFVTKFAPTGNSLVYSTLLGGAGDDVGRGIAVDSKGNAYIAGDSASTNFPINRALQPKNAGHRDVFVSKISPTGLTLQYSSYFGGAGEELASLAVDPAGAVWLVGLTTSTNLPLTNAIQSEFGGGVWDAFVARLSPAGDKLAFSTYFGGTGNDQAAAIALAQRGNAYVVGASSSSNLATVKPVQATNRGGQYDAFVLKLSEPLAPQDATNTLANIATTNASPLVNTNLPTPPTEKTELIITNAPLLAITNHAVEPVAATPTNPPPAEAIAPKKNTTNEIAMVEKAQPTETSVTPPAQSIPETKPEQAAPATNTPPPAPSPLVKTDAVTPPVAKTNLLAANTIKTTPPPAAKETIAPPPQKSVDELLETHSLAVAPPPANAPTNRFKMAAIQPVSTATINEKEPLALSPSEASKAEAIQETKPAQETPAPPKTPLDAKWLQHPLYNTNLVVDADAEAATPSASSYKITPPPGWNTTSNLTALRYGTIGGFPTTNNVPTGGSNFFAGGPDSQVSVGTQATNIASLAAPIDAEQLQCVVSGLFGSMSSQKDNAILEVVFKDEAGQETGKTTTVPVLPKDREFRTQLLPRTASSVIPPKTRSLEIRLVLTRVDGTYNDAYADNLSVVITSR